MSTDNQKTGINSDEWREGYSSGQKSFFAKNNQTHTQRLEKMNVLSLKKDSQILDIGCGNGNLIAFLEAKGFTDLAGIEPDAELIKEQVSKTELRAGKASSLPWEDKSFDAVLVMAAMHHFETDEELEKSLNEIHRVLKPGGQFSFCEPSNTLTRSVLTKILMSPLSSLFTFSRNKKLMVLDEWDTLNWWLALEKNLPPQLEELGFRILENRREKLKTYLVAKKKA